MCPTTAQTKLSGSKVKVICDYNNAYYTTRCGTL